MLIRELIRRLEIMCDVRYG